MSPEEIEQVFTAVSKAMQSEPGGNGPIYVFISVIVTISPFVFRYFKKTFVLSIEKVMDVHIKQLEDMNKIMHLHIDELQGMKLKQEEMEEVQRAMGLDIRENKTKLGSLKELINDKCS